LMIRILKKMRNRWILI